MSEELFDSTKETLKSILNSIENGGLQLPDFQRGWVWDDEHVLSLLNSVSRSFPIGSIMLLQTGGDFQFKTRPIEGVPASTVTPNFLILDGQQRLTSLYQVLFRLNSVKTTNAKKKEVSLYYYVDIRKLLDPCTRDEAFFSVPEDKILRRNFGRDIETDLSSLEKEVEHLCFPCNLIFQDTEAWSERVTDIFGRESEEKRLFKQFKKQIIEEAFRPYNIPKITLTNRNSKEAVCLVFEKVNTGGMPLSIFELVTAGFAADGFNLRGDWGLRQKKIKERKLLDDVESSDFLQGIAILHSFHLRQDDLTAGKSGREVTAVSAKREYILNLPLNAYKKWAPLLVDGFIEAANFLYGEGFYLKKFLPYRSQLIPLAVMMVLLKERWHEPVIHKKLLRWYWCGILGELYGSAIETRIALDVIQLQDWIENTGLPPKTVEEATFRSGRLDSLRTRTSAAYRGIYVLLQKRQPRDFFWRDRITDLSTCDMSIDIHHIFPQEWCISNNIESHTYNSIVNKTAISAKANRMIGGNAPSSYLTNLLNNERVGYNIAEQDDILKSHCIAPETLRHDQFEQFYQQRKTALLQLIREAMDKEVLFSSESIENDNEEDEDI